MITYYLIACTCICTWKNLDDGCDLEFKVKSGNRVQLNSVSTFGQGPHCFSTLPVYMMLLNNRSAYRFKQVGPACRHRYCYKVYYTSTLSTTLSLSDTTRGFGGSSTTYVPTVNLFSSSLYASGLGATHGLHAAMCTRTISRPWLGLRLFGLDSLAISSPKKDRAVG